MALSKEEMAEIKVKAAAKAKEMMKPKAPVVEDNWATRLKKKVKSWFAEEKAKEKPDATTEGLKLAGVTDAEIKRLQGKK